MAIVRNEALMMLRKRERASVTVVDVMLETEDGQLAREFPDSRPTLEQTFSHQQHSEKIVFGGLDSSWLRTLIDVCLESLIPGRSESISRPFQDGNLAKA